MRILWLICFLLLPSIGCDSNKSAAKATTNNHERWQRYGNLHGMSLSHSESIRAARERLLQLRRTPGRIRGAAARPETVQLQEQWGKVFSKQIRGMVARRTKELYPRCLDDAKILATAIRYRLRYEKKRTAIQQYLAKPKFQLPRHHDRGWLGSFDFIDNVWIAVRLEGLVAAESLSHGHLDDALRALRIMWQWSDRLVPRQQLIARLEGAAMRRDILALVGAIANHPKGQPTHHVQLTEMLTRQLKNWPHDRRAWIGDLCDGLVVYELVRDGYITSLLAEAEIEKLKKGAGIKPWLSTIARGIDEDQLFFLTAAQQQIDACDQPFHSRQAVLTKIEDEITARRGTKHFPYIAGEMLLKDLGRGHRLQALDRARCEAWLMLLCQRVKRPVPTEVVHNPVDGQPYTIKRTGKKSVIKITAKESIELTMP